MFYVADGKIYSTEYDNNLKVYREVRMTLGADDAVVFKPMNTGVSKRPKNRILCTASELIAQYGTTLKYEVPVQHTDAIVDSKEHKE